jgi:hypothetical protein
MGGGREGTGGKGTYHWTPVCATLEAPGTKHIYTPACKRGRHLMNWPKLLSRKQRCQINFEAVASGSL